MENNCFFTNSVLIQYLTSKVWGNKIGGKLGLHIDTVPKIWDGSRDLGAVPGVSYITSFMDGYTDMVHRENKKDITDFISSIYIGCIIYQDIPVYLPKQHKKTFRNMWIKIDLDKWSYNRSVVSEGVVRTPWGAEN